MFEKDWNIVEHSLQSLPTKHSFGEETEFINPYQNRKLAQGKCRHMWENDTDATYIVKNGKRKCAICGREF